MTQERVLTICRLMGDLVEAARESGRRDERRRYNPCSGIAEVQDVEKRVADIRKRIVAAMIGDDND